MTKLEVLTRSGLLALEAVTSCQPDSSVAARFDQVLSALDFMSWQQRLIAVTELVSLGLAGMGEVRGSARIYATVDGWETIFEHNQ